VSRRNFLRATTGLTGTALLAACAAPSAPASTPAPAAPASTEAATTAAATAAPAPAGGEVGGEYRVLAGGNMRSLDPPAAEGFEDWWSAGVLLTNMLYFYDKDGKFYADLAAAEPTISADSMTYTIPIRKGVKFHNGREMTADDVKFSLERQLWPEVYSWGKTYMNNVVGYQDVIDGKTKDLTGVKVIDPSTVEIKLTKPQAVFSGILSMTMNAIIPKQETLDAGKDWGVTKMIGTGAFKFVEWVPEERAVYERNPDYFKSGLPHIEKVTLNLKLEPAIRLLKYESGEGELLVGIPAAERPRVMNDATLGALLRRSPSMEVTRLNMHFKGKATSNLKVRQAIAMGVDKNAILQANAGVGVIVDSTYATRMLQFDPEFKSKWQFNPDEAKRLLAEAGYGDGLTLNAWFSPGAMPTNGLTFQADMKNIGINVELIEGEAKDVESRLKSGEIEVYQRGWSASFPDAFDYISSMFTVAAIKSGFNFSQYENPKIDEMLDEAEKLPLTDPKRIQLYRDIDNLIVNEDVASVNLLNAEGMQLGVAKVTGDALLPVFGLPTLETAQMTA
jgi:peptide/nickel transport system substrate-binding protein/oligopeptide transport system substrate-binding protein